MTRVALPSIEEQREALRTRRIEARHRHRVLFVGAFLQGSTDVVACLKRALESVGHTVFHVDTGLHREILDESSGAMGGYGPLYLQVELLRPILDRFAPQVLVTCAGGIVLDVDAASELRQRGIVTIGVTLSDPDVQESVIDYVNNVDYHTTNAALALQRYEERGIRNTFLFPFGIDRDFVLRDVPPDPTLRADAICIGHAIGRPDRHAVMTELADRVDVRVYGKGWPIPGAKTVMGDRLLQAAREGTFHVNFPATRAGFTNVKCGVFESVGVGAVLCTAEFDEMARLFDYGSEIVGYRDAADLGDTLEELLRDPARIEDMRRHAFHRLVSEHLYEHRWIALFDAIHADAAAESPMVGAERAAEIRQILAADTPRPRTVVISGFYGASNRGDDVLLDALAGGIKRRVADVHIVVGAANARPVEVLQGWPAFDRTDPHAAEYWAARASSLVLGPGGLWHDYTIQQAGGLAGVVNGATVSPSHLAQLPLLTKGYGGDFHVFGMGVGPLRAPAAEAAVRLAAQLADSIVVRDERSKELLEAIPEWDWPVTTAPDIAYTMPIEPPQSPPDGRRYVVLNVRTWKPQADSIDRVAAATLDVARRHDLDVVAVPMQGTDMKELHRVLDGADHSGAITFLPLSAPWDDFVATLAGAEVVVAMRLHTCLFAHRLGRACVGIDYDPKVAAHFAELDRSEHVLAMPVTEQAVAGAVERALKEGPLTSATRAAVGRLERHAESAVDVLCERLAAAQVRAVHPGGAALTPPRSGRRLLPTGWKPADLVEIGGKLSAGNTTDPLRVVTATRTIGLPGLTFYLDATSPRRDDFATWRIGLPATAGKGLRAEMWITGAHPERPKRRGHLAYEVWVDGQRLFQHDVAAWKQRNSVWFATRPKTDEVVVEIKIVVLRDCDGGGTWGRSAAVTLEAMRAMWWGGSTSLVWGASSPAALAEPPPVVPEKPAPTGVARTMRRGVSGIRRRASGLRRLERRARRLVRR